jgi:hypothetical protein
LLLVLGYAFRRRRQQAHMRHGRLVALGVSIAASVTGCASSSGADARQDPTESDASDCAGRAEPVAAGLSKVSAGGYVFVLTALEPAVPVQSPGPPGNTWTVSIADPAGNPVTGATLLVTSYMPDHAHSGPPAPAIEVGGGAYEVDSLILPMPALYQITSTLTLPDGTRESVVTSLCTSAS